MVNKLHTGDCLPWLATLPDNSADALITDPPYASSGLHATDRRRPASEKYQSSGTTRQYYEFGGDHRDQRSHFQWCALWLAECFRVLRIGAPVCLFTDWRQLPLTSDALQVAGFVWRGIAVWDKTEAVRPYPGRFRAQAEYIVWGSKGDLLVDRAMPVLPGVYRTPIRQADKHHLTGKPTDLMRCLVKICEPGGLIIDPFSGSGTTLVAAQMEGYRWLGCEMSPEYAAVANSRLNGALNGVYSLFDDQLNTGSK